MCNSHCEVCPRRTRYHHRWSPPVVPVSVMVPVYRSRSRSRYCTAGRFSDCPGPSLLSSILLYSISETELQKPMALANEHMHGRLMQWRLGWRGESSTV